MLRRQLHNLTIKPGTQGCVVLSGQFTDPYTGRQITFHRSAARQVQIDHIYPLAKAWDLGAAAWPAGRRVDFANDVRLNLLAVDGAANASKGDDDLGNGPGEWMPLNAAYRCTYVLRYLEVARAWQLPITATDRESALAVAPSCK
ncbi:HNH endonuclease family protein [Kribbella sp. NPDC059898]|uniref:HNH endonuclease family protein n=1 Tax=Kribbella sp. NPDC059898 TaxID=3346995 RepID=UPI00365BC5F8